MCGIFQDFYNKKIIKKKANLTGVQSPTSQRGQLSTWQLCRINFSSAGQWTSGMILPSRSTHWAFLVWIPPPQLCEHFIEICQYLDGLLLDHHHDFKYLAPWMELPMGGIACSGAGFRLRRRIRQMAALARIHWNGRSAVRRKRFLFALFGHVPDPRSTVGGTLWSMSYAPSENTMSHQSRVNQNLIHIKV